MILPNKVVSVEASALSHAPLVLALGPTPVTVSGAYQQLADEFESIDQFLLTLDLLFVLKRIDVNVETGVLSYVDQN